MHDRSCETHRHRGTNISILTRSKLSANFNHIARVTANIIFSLIVGVGSFVSQSLAQDSNRNADQFGRDYARRDLSERCFSPQDFGAIADGEADDTRALKKWLALSAEARSQRSPCLFLPTGIYRATDNLVMNMPPHSHGPRIWGTCGGSSRISFDRGYGFTLTSSTALFYGDFRCISFSGNSDKVLVNFSTSISDALNGFNLDNIVVNNDSENKESVALKFNGLYMSRVFATANCNGLGQGIGIQMTAGSMNTIKISAGNCHTGLNLTGDVDAINGNLFDAIDLEVNKVQLLIDGKAVQSNTFIGGVLSFSDPGTIGINAVAGSGNVFKNMAYGGAGKLFEGTSGIIWESALQDLTVTPPVPASEETISNAHVQPSSVNIFGGQVSSVLVNRAKACDTVPCMVILMPGDIISVRYSDKPAWLWRALKF